MNPSYNANSLSFDPSISIHLCSLPIAIPILVISIIELLSQHVASFILLFIIVMDFTFFFPTTISCCVARMLWAQIFKEKRSEELIFKSFYV